ncbi:hypothetical protein [Glaciihabitans sp. UYNi722]|uniref:hypothetical protein n=1 Tax=Glaciihabitans sp. UYNi722 TaxID=3156344 RepID=UPI00339AA08A
MSKTRPRGRYKITLRSPASEAVFGSFLLIAGMLFLGMILATPDAPLAVGLLLFVMFGGLGAPLIVMAVARHRWIRAYHKVAGHSPPY